MCQIIQIIVDDVRSRHEVCRSVALKPAGTGKVTDRGSLARGAIIRVVASPSVLPLIADRYGPFASKAAHHAGEVFECYIAE